MGLIKITNLTLGYDKKAILKGINANIEEGDFVCCVGPNGVGKSTLIKTILGLIKPLSGSIEFNGLKRKYIGYMPQETKVDASFPASVYEIVLSGNLNKTGINTFYNKNIKEKTTKVLKILNIENLKNESFNNLSGGQRQKVLLARSLCATTKLLILDEPSNNLDITSKKELYDCIKRLNEIEKITIIMITHDLDHDNLIGNKILSLRENDVFYGTTEDFIRRIHHE